MLVGSGDGGGDVDMGGCDMLALAVEVGDGELSGVTDDELDPCGEEDADNEGLIEDDGATDSVEVAEGTVDVDADVVGEVEGAKELDADGVGALDKEDDGAGLDVTKIDGAIDGVPVGEGGA